MDESDNHTTYQYDSAPSAIGEIPKDKSDTKGAKSHTKVAVVGGRKAVEDPVQLKTLVLFIASS